MKKEFWLERWEREETGFHQADINAYLVRYWEELGATPGARVFVPLCGKSRDMLWLREQGHPVLGVELSPIAVQAFFEENGFSPSHVRGADFECCEAEDIRILCGDIFDLGKDDLKDVMAVYDRASLVALPPEMRERYANHLLDILPSGAKILLLAFDYDQSQMSGPPFAVSPDEVRSLYGRRAEIRLLEQLETLDDNPRFKVRGLTSLRESIYLLTKK